MSENVRVTAAMIQAGADAWPNLDDSTDEKLFGGLYRAMTAVDPLAAAERAVIEAAVALHKDCGGGLVWVSPAVKALLRLRAAQESGT